jgi:hypothetical protein
MVGQLAEHAVERMLGHVFVSAIYKRVRGASTYRVSKLHESDCSSAVTSTPHIGNNEHRRCSTVFSRKRRRRVDATTENGPRWGAR